MSQDIRRLVVVPSDPIAAYERAGFDWLQRYYNPAGFFQEVYALSPLEKGERQAYGMTIRGVSARNFTAALQELRPQVVRAYGGFWPADMVCRHRLYGVPVVVSVHDTNLSLLHHSVCYADLVICVSQAVAEQVRAIGVDPERIRVLPNRVDLGIFHPIKDRGMLQVLEHRFPPGKYLLHIGRKAKQKNLDTVIRALALLPSDYHCIFVGAGDATPYQTLADQLRVAQRCFWIESIKNSELPLWYTWCNCMCTPSRWEGFGIVFIEASACGTPIVTSDTAPMNEYLVHNESACLVKEYENPQALALAVQRVCEDDDYRQILSAGAIRVGQLFDHRRVDDMEVAIYQEAQALSPNYLRYRAKWNEMQLIGRMVSPLQSLASHVIRFALKHNSR